MPLFYARLPCIEIKLRLPSSSIHLWGSGAVVGVVSGLTSGFTVAWGLGWLATDPCTTVEAMFLLANAAHDTCFGGSNTAFNNSNLITKITTINKTITKTYRHWCFHIYMLNEKPRGSMRLWIWEHNLTLPFVGYECNVKNFTVSALYNKA